MFNKMLERQVVYEGNRVRLELHHLEDEESGRKHKREVVVHPGAVVVLPFVDAEHILLIRNRRYAVNDTLIELPAGTLEKNEDPMNCAGRELVEETGYIASRLKSLGDFYTSPGVLSEKMYAFAAYDLTRAQAAPELGEEIELAPASLDEAIDMIRGRQIKDAKTIATLLMYDRFFRKR